MATGKQPRTVTACTMLKRMLFRYQGNVSAALVLGGVDCNGPSLYTVYPHGSTDSLPYVTMGSGSLAAMAVFESQYKSGMTLEEAKALVHAGIMAGINNDLGSGGSVDLMVITKEGHTPLRNCTLHATACSQPLRHSIVSLPPWHRILPPWHRILSLDQSPHSVLLSTRALGAHLTVWLTQPLQTTGRTSASRSATTPSPAAPPPSSTKRSRP